MSLSQVESLKGIYLEFMQALLHSLLKNLSISKRDAREFEVDLYLYKAQTSM